VTIGQKGHSLTKDGEKRGRKVILTKPKIKKMGNHLYQSMLMQSAETAGIEIVKEALEKGGRKNLRITLQG